MEDWLLARSYALLRAAADPAGARLSLRLGVVLSLSSGSRGCRPPLGPGPRSVYVEFARGISSIILLFIMAIAIPILLEVGQASLMMLASVALGINMGGYGAEIVRGAIQAVPRGQTEASIALNLSPTQRLRHVVLPQAMRMILPPLGNLTIEILKGTALVCLIGVTDIMQATRNLSEQQLLRRGGRRHRVVRQRADHLLRDRPGHQRPVPSRRVAARARYRGRRGRGAAAPPNRSRG